MSSFTLSHLYTFQNLLFSSEVCLHKAQAISASLGFPKAVDFLDVLSDMEIVDLGYILQPSVQPNRYFSSYKCPTQCPLNLGQGWGSWWGGNGDWEMFLYLLKQETKNEVWLKYQAKINVTYSLSGWSDLLLVREGRHSPSFHSDFWHFFLLFLYRWL